jgi:hypothetical protein
MKCVFNQQGGGHWPSELHLAIFSENSSVSFVWNVTYLCQRLSLRQLITEVDYGMRVGDSSLIHNYDEMDEMFN